MSAILVVEFSTTGLTPLRISTNLLSLRPGETHSVTITVFCYFRQSNCP